MSGEAGGVIAGGVVVVGGVALLAAAIPIIVGGGVVAGAIKGGVAIAKKAREYRETVLSEKTESASKDVFRHIQSSNAELQAVIENSQNEFVGRMKALGNEIKSGGDYSSCYEVMLNGRNEFVTRVINDGEQLAKKQQEEVFDKLADFERDLSEKTAQIREAMEGFAKDREEYKAEVKALSEETYCMASEHVMNMSTEFSTGEKSLCYVQEAERMLDNARTRMDEGEYEAALIILEKTIGDVATFFSRTVKESGRKQLYYHLCFTTANEIDEMISSAYRMYEIDGTDAAIGVAYQEERFAGIAKRLDDVKERLFRKNPEEYEVRDLEVLFFELNSMYSEVMHLTLEAEISAIAECSRQGYAESIIKVMEKNGYTCEAEEAGEGKVLLQFGNDDNDEVSIVLLPDDTAEESFRTQIDIFSNNSHIDEDTEDERKRLRKAIKEEIESSYKNAKVTMECRGKRKKNYSQGKNEVAVRARSSAVSKQEVKKVGVVKVTK